MTYQNLGYWIGQANDTSTGRHPTGWTNGQRWNETAPEWMAMYDSSQSALATMTADRDYWRDTVAHGDPNVWTNRYNAGYSAGVAASMAKIFTATLGAGQYVVYDNPQVVNLNVVETSDPAGMFSTSGPNMTAARTGTYIVYAMLLSNSNQWGAQSGWHLNICVNGGAQGLPASGQTAGGMDGNPSRPHAFWRGVINAGSYLHIQADWDGGGYRYDIHGSYLQVVELSAG